MTGAPIPPITRVKDLIASRPLVERLLGGARMTALSIRGLLARPPADSEWVIFPFYHWVLDDERGAFAEQLRNFRKYGDFLALDDVVSLLGNSDRLGGRFFCITFDDGFSNCYTNAAPILADLNVPAAFFLPTNYIGLSVDKDWDRLAPFFANSWTRFRRRFDFLTWDQCRAMLRAGLSFGSHTHTHMRLISNTSSDVRREMETSKQIIERELGVPCRHFACPWGRPGRDFDPAAHPQIAAEVGYETFLTVQEGPNLLGDSPMMLRRNAVTPSFRGGCLRYHLWLTR